MKVFRTWKRNGVYYVAYQAGPRVQWHSTGLRNYGEVVKKFSTGLPLDTPKTLRLSEFIKMLEDRAAGYIRPGTLRSYKLALEQLKTVVGDKHLKDISAADIEAFARRRTKANAKPITVNIGLRAISACLNKAKRWGVIKDVPTIELLQVRRLPPMYLTKSDLLTVLKKVADPNLAEIFSFAFFTGCRLSEIVSLPWKHVDLEHKMVTIGPWEHFETKNGRTRSIPLFPEIVWMLEWRESQKNGPYVFHHGGKPWAPLYISTRFKKTCIDAGFPDAHFHTLRHSFASMLVQNGVPIFTVSNLLGHHSVTVTEIYSHLAPHKLLQDADLLRAISVA